MPDKGQKLRSIPSMDIILGYEWVQSWLDTLGRMRVKRIINAELSRMMRVWSFRQTTSERHV